LSSLPDDLPISTEGCDCVGPSSGILIEGDIEGMKVVIINRNDSLQED